MATILVLHGPNLNMLGEREPEVYGTTTLADINQGLEQLARDHQHHLLAMQSNAEYELVERIQEARHEGVNYIIINPAAYTHSSVAIRDALAAMKIPFIEVHISNTFNREEFRHQSYIAPNAQGVILGFGLKSYELAIQNFI